MPSLLVAWRLQVIVAAGIFIITLFCCTHNSPSPYPPCLVVPLSLACLTGPCAPLLCFIRRPIRRTTCHHHPITAISSAPAPPSAAPAPAAPCHQWRRWRRRPCRLVTPLRLPLLLPRSPTPPHRQQRLAQRRSSLVMAFCWWVVGLGHID
jgi:hypothetical protein